MLSGMNVGRINFSHGNYKDQDERVIKFKSIREELGLPIPLLLDTQGPEIRIGKFENDSVYLEKGQLFTLINNDELGTETRVSITYKNLSNEIEVGRTILINDGTIELRVKEFNGKDVVCEVIQGGKLTNRKSINIPDFVVNLPGITLKDVEDIKYGIEAGFDYIAASFVRKPQDILDIRQVLEENNGSHIKVIAKIENREGINNFDEILEVADGIMIARGDLGVEIPMEEVPVLQKQFIKKTYKKGKPVITATQMLESMCKNPRPTRAEVSDVANAVYDETNAIMLSGECAIGKFPLECVQTMDKIATSVDNDMNLWKRFTRRAQERGILNPDIVMTDLEASIARTTCVTALQINADAIAAYTHTGSTVTRIAGLRPKCPIIAITDSRKTYHQLSVSWNVYPVYVDSQEKAAKVLYKGIETLKQEGFLEEGDTVLLSGGPRTKVVGETESKVLGGVVRV